MRIIYKLVISSYAIVLIVSIVCFVAIRSSQSMFRNEIGETVVSMTTLIAREMDNRIYERVDHFHEFIVSKDLRDYLTQSNMYFENMDNIKEFIDNNDREWTTVPPGTYTPFMKSLIDNDLSNEIRKKTAFYNEEHNYKIYGEVFITNKFGANVAQTGKTSDYRQDDEDWWQSARNNEFYLKDIAYDDSAGVYSTDVALRINDEDGKFIGVIKIVLNIEDTFDYLRKSVVSGRYKDVKVKLLTKEGKNIYSTGGDEFLKDFSKDEFFTLAKGVTGFIVDEDSDNQANVFAYARSKGFGWILFSEYNTEEIFAPLHRFNKRLFLLAGSMFILSLVISYVIARTISVPIEKLKNIAKEIADGKLETKIDINSKDEIGEMASVLGRMTDELKHRATVDYMTQTFNRAKLDEIIPMEIARARRYQRFLSIIILDIDYFKKVNDVYGHNAGDYVLKTIAYIIKSKMRKTNYLFRLGGEEFLIVVPEVDLNGTGILAERIRTAIGEYRFETVGTVTASLGLAQLIDDDTVDSLLNRADEALYQAKETGRNRIASVKVSATSPQSSREWLQDGSQSV